MFRRRKNEPAASTEPDASNEQAVEAASEELPIEDLLPAQAPPQGPWDEADAPEDELNRIDLGGLRVPVLPDTEVRVDVSPEGEVVAATLVQGQSAMQVNAFAAPRRSGIWAEVRSEIAEALRASGGGATDGEGPYGAELHAQVPTEVPDGGGTALAPARFVGIDGPRWFLRALITGPGATDVEAAEPLLAALRRVVVVRGGEAMAVRDPLPLRLPKEVAAAATASASAESAPLPPPERGPEISELR
ncbi:MAG: DUF3710 domain-containing protein [Mycobacteriales bacterium]